MTLYRVLEPFLAYERVGDTDRSNTYVGSSVALIPVYLERTLQPGELLLSCPAGLFLVGPEYAQLELRLREQHLFEHGGAAEPPLPLGKLAVAPEQPLPEYRRRTARVFSFERPEQHGVCRWYGRGPVLVYSELMPAD